jgi:arylsulfatase A-like enzyme
MRVKLVLALTFVLIGLMSLDSSGVERPNVLFLFADDQRPDTIAAYGNQNIDTPNMDRLVSRGFSFRQNYCMGSIHGAVCQPSRAMLMSGRTLYRVPMNLRGVKMLPELLQENGYVTFGSGKWHNHPESFLRGFSQGKAAFMGGMSDHTKVPVADVSQDGSKLVNKRKGEKFSSELFADAVVEFLEGHSSERPFFAYVAFTAPHDPRQPPGKYRQMYYDRLPPLPPNFMPQHPFHNGWMVGRDETLAPWPRTEKVVRDQLAEYYGMITHLDNQIGRILGVLQETGQADNTIIIYAADHGLAVGSHGLLGKQNLYEHSMGCPLIVAGPGIPAGQSSQALTYLYDLYPTICDLLGLEPPASVEGSSLQPIWTGDVTGVRQSLFTTYENKMRAVRDHRWKLIRYPLINHTQLFDLEKDPDELTNLADNPQQADRVELLMELLADWQQKTDDEQPLTSTNPEPMEIDLTSRLREPDRWQPRWIIDKYFE